MLGVLNEFFAGFLLTLRQPIESFIALETADDEQTLVAGDGSLVSYIRVDGARQIIGDAEYLWMIDQAVLKLGSRFDRPGFAMQVYFSRDPERVDTDLTRRMRPSRVAMRAVGLDLEDLVTERQRNLKRYTAHEEIYLVLWTRPSVLNSAEKERTAQARSERKWPMARDAQFPFAALEPLRLRHKSFVSAMAASFEELGMQCAVVSAHEALASVRASLFPEVANDEWKACLPGDPISIRQPEARLKGDVSDLLWPPIKRQICVGAAQVMSNTIVQVGSQLWGAVDMTLGPMEPAPFTQLLGRLIESNMPFRVSFLIESGGTGFVGFRKLATSLLGFTNSINKQIKNSLDSVISAAQNEAVVRLRVSLATWAPAGQKRLLETRLATLLQAVESWGYCQATQIAGDPLEAVLSSSLGIACASTAVPAIVPLKEVVKLLPWQRASSPFREGSVLLRTPDGRIWPYQMGSSLTTTWFDLIFAQPGAGKSVLMNSLNLGTCFSAGTARLPFIAILDIGPSSSGLISLIRDALPVDRRHEAMHFKLRMTPEYAVNPFDTQLGARYPLPEERSYLIELLTLLCTPPGQAVPYDGIPQLVGMTIDEMFRWRADEGANTEARPYLSQVVPEVDEALLRHNIHLPTEPLWWDVVDALYDAGATHEAGLAQRHAVPTLVDAVTAARRPQIRALLEETQIGASAESVIHAFERMIASSIREFPILAGVTRFDIGQARICAVDLQDVAPQGDETADRQTAIMYMLARHALIRSWWLGPESLRAMPARFRPYHETRLREIRETPKRICFDEFHRTSKTAAVRAQVVRDVREGRKWGVQIVLASQLLEDFSDEMVDLATGVWICGAAVSERAVTTAAERFGLSDTARWIMRYRLTGPRATGAPVLLVLGTNEGRYEQHLINTLGPVELWALSTSAEDVEIRNRLYTRLSAPRARRILAQTFPGGTARHEIRRRVVMRTEGGEVEAGALTAVINGMVDELVEMAMMKIVEGAEE